MVFSGIRDSVYDAGFLLSDLIPKKKDILPSILLFIAYFVAAKVTHALIPPGSIAPAFIWPPAAVALAGVFLYGYGVVPALVLASILNIWSLPNITFVSVFTGTFSNMLFAVAGSYVMRRFDYLPSLARLRDGYTLMGVALFISFIPPIVSVSLQYLTSSLPIITADGLGERFVRIWGGMVFSAVVIMPFITSWLSSWRIHLRGRDLLELSIALGSITAMSVLIFLTTYAQILGGLVFLVILFPFLWISMRFEARFAALGLIIMSVLAIAGVLVNVNESTQPLGARLYTVQLFMVFMAFISFFLASLVQERRKALSGLQSHIGQLEIALAQIRGQDKQKTEFLAVLAHELRNPLAPIVSALELLKLKGSWKEEAETYNLIEDRVRTMRRLLDDLMDISRITQGKFKLQREALDVRNIAERAVTSIKYSLDDLGQKVSIDVPDEMLLLDADIVRVEQVFRNLLSNASKFSAPGATIHILIKRHGDMARIEVQDTGIGMDPTMLSKVFEPFHQLESGEKNRDGIGVGLSLTKHIVEMHGGTIQALSAGKGQGSQFVVRLPLSTTPQIAKTTPAEEKISPAPSSVLVVDDNIQAARSLGKLLELTGHSVRYAYTGEEALQRIEEAPSRFVLLDIELPDMSGYKVAQKMRQSKFDGTIIALTGYGQEDDKRRAFDAGFNHHLVKPVGLKDLQTVLVAA